MCVCVCVCVCVCCELVSFVLAHLLFCVMCAFVGVVVCVLCAHTYMYGGVYAHLFPFACDCEFVIPHESGVPTFTTIT